MSFDHISFAMSAEQITPEQKLVLILLADDTDMDGCCWTDERWLSWKACMPKSRADAVVKSLVNAGFLSYHDAKHPVFEKLGFRKHYKVRFPSTQETARCA